MNEDLWRLIAVLGASFLLGLLADHLLLCLLLGLAGYMYWQYRGLKRLLLWLRRSSGAEPPTTPGLVDEIAQEFDYLRSHHSQRKQKLSGYLKRFQEAVAALPDAVVVLGEHDTIEWANDKAAEYIGIKWSQDAGQRISNLIRYPKLVHFLSEEKLKTKEKRLEIVSPVDAELRLEIRVASYGENQRLLVARNITRLHRINQMRSDFIANASHELRTPLTVIAGYLDSLIDDRDGSPEIWHEQLTRMQLQTNRMRRLIEDLLKLASLESEEDDEVRIAINVPDMLVSICREAKDLSAELKHDIQVNAEADLWIKGESKQLRSAFSNLAFNAVKYSPKGSLIQLNWYQNKLGIHFEVIDEGEGISAEHLPRLTERFYRVDAGRSRDKGGTGLGLAIVKHVLARHGAKLEISSKLHKGSTFHCSFPRNLLVEKREDAIVSSISA